MDHALSSSSLPAEHRLTLEAVKRIWLSYSPLRLGIRSSPGSGCRVVEQNVLCLDLGLAGSTGTSAPRAASKNGLAPINTAASASAEQLETAAVMEVERELGEISEDSRRGSDPSSSQDESTPGPPGSKAAGDRRLARDQARSTLTDSLFKTLKTRDPQCGQSREQVFQKYVAHLDDHQLDQLVTIGRDIFDDLTRMGDMGRKHPVTLPERVGDRRVKPRLAKVADDPLLTSTPTPLIHSSQSQSQSQPQSPPSKPGTDANVPTSVTCPLPPSHPHPVILVVKEGRPHAAVIDATFDLSGLLRPSPSVELLSSFRILLCCLSKSAVENTCAERPPSASPSYLAEAFYNLDTVWPTVGGLFVSLNHGHSNKAGTWTPQNFAENARHIDITNYALPGENTMRLIQLHDHSSFVFFVLAIPRLDSEDPGKGMHMVPRTHFCVSQLDEIIRP